MVKLDLATAAAIFTTCPRKPRPQALFKPGLEMQEEQEEVVGMQKPEPTPAKVPVHAKIAPLLALKPQPVH